MMGMTGKGRILQNKRMIANDEHITINNGNILVYLFCRKLSVDGTFGYKVAIKYPLSKKRMLTPIFPLLVKAFKTG